MLNEEAIKKYLIEKFNVEKIGIERLGAGVHGEGFLVKIYDKEVKTFVIKGLFHEGLGHDYPSDRAQVFLLGLETYNDLPKHAKAIDVLSVLEDGSVRSIGGGKEYYFLMEKVEGRDYFNDLKGFSKKEKLEPLDVKKIKAMTSYLSQIHSTKKDSRSLYWRKLRDIIGHGECLMGVFDTYPDGIISYKEMAEIEKLCIDWRAALKPKIYRLSQIHGDFHPGNILFKKNEDEIDFILLDRSRGPFGEPADDLTALCINYIFFSVQYHGDVQGAYLEGLRLFFEDYIKLTGDEEILSVVAPFFAFRGVVVANPIFYPDLNMDSRKKIFNFAKGVLKDKAFDINKVNIYIEGS